MRKSMVLVVLLLAGCSDGDSIKTQLNGRLSDSGVKVKKVDVGRDVGRKCKSFMATTASNGVFYGVFRFKNGSIDDNYSPNFYICDQYESPSDAERLALCN